MCMLQKAKMKTLEYYKLNKYNEVDYIKKFVVGISKEELIKMFRKHIIGGFLTQLIGTKLLKEKDEKYK